MLRFELVSVGGVVLALQAAAAAAVVPVAYYRLGEADPGAVAGNQANATTVDSVGAKNLTRDNNPVGDTDSPLYTSDVSPAVGQNGESTLAVDFAGDDFYFGSAAATAAVDNFGIELFVESDSTVNSPNARIAYNGSSGGSGFGIYRLGGNYAGLIGGKGTVGSVAATGGRTHLALVREDGVLTFYVNGVANGTAAHVPNAAAAEFSIGGTPGNAQGTSGAEFHDGRIDEVRVFTIPAGEGAQFSTNDLLINVPEPAGLGLALAGLAAVTRRRFR